MFGNIWKIFKNFQGYFDVYRNVYRGYCQRDFFIPPQKRRGMERINLILLVNLSSNLPPGVS